MDFIILLSAVLKHVVICRKLQKIAPFGIVIDLWKSGVCVYIHTIQREREFDCLHFEGLLIFTLLKSENASGRKRSECEMI